MTLTSYGTKIDARDVAPRDRHSLIFATYRSLGVGETMELVNDRDPKPLYYEFQADMPGCFGWDCLQSGPELWRVRITKVTHPHANGQCCGACGGA
ncbi:MAG: DUF2249 domain-containing protein [Burkholderiaceae bacterium]